MITVAKKFHLLPSATWRPRKAGDTIQYKPKDLTLKGANGISPCLSLRPENQKC
jgi:hypothetical protein